MMVLGALALLIGLNVPEALGVSQPFDPLELRECLCGAAALGEYCSVELLAATSRAVVGSACSNGSGSGASGSMGHAQCGDGDGVLHQLQQGLDGGGVRCRGEDAPDQWVVSIEPTGHERVVSAPARAARVDRVYFGRYPAVLCGSGPSSPPRDTDAPGGGGVGGAILAARP